MFAKNEIQLHTALMLELLTELEEQETRALGKQEQQLKPNAKNYYNLHIFTENVICFLCSFGSPGNKEYCFPSFRPTPPIHSVQVWHDSMMPSV